MKKLPKPRTRVPHQKLCFGTEQASSVRGKKGILIAFGELFLKSKGVKNIFQKRLIENICFLLKKEETRPERSRRIDFKIHSFRERIFVEVTRVNNVTRATKVIKRVFGISWFAECLYFPETNLKEFADFVSKNYKDWIKEKESFAIRLKKYDRKIIDKIAEDIDRKVDLNNPKKELFIEQREAAWFLYFKKQKGAGGFPANSSGKVLTLMSGGIDSPVAAYLVAKKGVQNIWLHFHSYPLVSNKSIEKIKELAKIFLNYQSKVKIYFVPFSKAQVEIKLKAPANYRILLYRRLMLKIAELIAEKEGCKALVTGESLGQVSSQTLPNLKNIEEAIKIPVLRPLISMDKEEIIDIARKIGTFDISIKPQEDCCTLFTPKHSTAEGKMEVIKKIEKKLNRNKFLASKSKKIIQQIIKGIEVKILDSSNF